MTEAASELQRGQPHGDSCPYGPVPADLGALIEWLEGLESPHQEAAGRTHDLLRWLRAHREV